MTVEEPKRRDESASDREVLAGKFGLAHDDAFFVRALTHRSYAHEKGLSAEKPLSFVGQPTLLAGVTDLVYDRSPEVTDRALSKLRSAAVAAPELAEVARSLRVGRNIRLGRGEKAGGGADKDSILADTLTALIGAVRLRLGMDQALALVYRLFDEPIERLLLLGPGLDWKNALKDLANDKGLAEPDYEAEQSGPDHQASFTAWVWVGKVKYGPGSGRSFKEAEKEAAAIAWRAISGRTTG